MHRAYRKYIFINISFAIKKNISFCIAVLFFIKQILKIKKFNFIYFVVTKLNKSEQMCVFRVVNIKNFTLKNKLKKKTKI